MAVKFIKGNLIELFKAGHFDVLVHGCNCYNIMGAGFAKQVKQHFPKAFQMDSEFIIPKGSYRLGNYSMISYEDNYIINAYTQLNTGKNFDITAFRLVMTKINELFLHSNIAVPGLIGCGLGGGNSKEVIQVLEEVFTDNTLTIVYPN